MGGAITRRQFSAGALAAGVAVSSKTAFAAYPANERVRLGVIGLGNRGDQLISAFKAQPDVEFAALCDVYAPYLAFANKRVGGEPFTTGDYRRILDRKDIDAVIVATPDHWHALQFIDACAAGKDVYVEKPLSLTIAEGRRMVQAAARYNRVTQVGLNRRSMKNLQKLAKLVQGGGIGKVTAARCFFIRNETPMGIGSPPDSQPPEGLDWESWLGPAPKVPYNENRCLYKFRWFRSYSGGQVTNMGTHYIDVIQWAMGQDAPRGVVAVGGRYAVQDDREIPDTMEAIWEYPNGALVTYTQYNANGAGGSPLGASVEIRGTAGTAYLIGDRVEIQPESVRTAPVPALDPTNRTANRQQSLATRPAGERMVLRGADDDARGHARNFLDCIKSRQPTNCPVEVGHRSTSTSLLANIALDRKRYLVWDAEREQVVNDPDANKLLSYEYRPPWKLPEV